VETGWGNGFIAIPENHKWYGKDFLEINKEINNQIHNNLCMSRYKYDCYINTFKWYTDLKFKIPENYYIIGFDTCNENDTLESCHKEFVEKETEKLKQIAIKNYN
jgi:hypothetical protein